MNVMPISKHILSIIAIAAVGMMTASAATGSGDKSSASVDHIQGIGKYKFGQLLKDIPPASIQPIDPQREYRWEHDGHKKAGDENSPKPHPAG